MAQHQRDESENNELLTHQHELDPYSSQQQTIFLLHFQHHYSQLPKLSRHFVAFIYKDCPRQYKRITSFNKGGTLKRNWDKKNFFEILSEKRGFDYL
jgi:hypothetical protein